MIEKVLELSIVVPVYNEHENIEEFLNSIHQNVSVSFEIIIVYDSSEDLTLPVVERIVNDSDNIILLENNICPGPSGAIRTGILFSNGANILVTMADLCDDHSQISHMLELIKSKADIVCPSRYSEGGEQLLNNKIKKWIPQFAGIMIKFFTNIPTNDPTNSYKMYSKRVFEDINLVSTVSFSVTLEIVAKASCLGFRIIEIPTVWKNRKNGSSNFKMGRSLFVYLPWFFVALLNGRFIRFSNQKLRKWFCNLKNDSTEYLKKE